MYLKVFINFTIALLIILLIAFSVLQSLHISAGTFLDWLIGGATFWWLLVIVTVPWNIYFESKEVLAEAWQSKEKGITVDEKQIKYVKILAKRSLILALALHIISAIALYILAFTGISSVGYIGSASALLLTILRPAVRGYDYLARRLAAIRSEVKYPREDIEELRNRVLYLEGTVEQLKNNLNPDNAGSFAAAQQREVQGIRNDLTRISSLQEQLKASNQAEHENLRREAQNAIAQLSADAQFLDRVREIIRFFKTA